MLSKPGPSVRPLKEKTLGTVGELSTSNPGAEAPRVPPEAPNVSARRADDANMGDEVAQRDISDAESISGAKIRELRRRNSPSDPASREIEDHVLTEHARSGHGVQLVSKGEVEPRDTKEKVTRNLRMAQRSQSCRWITAALELRIESMMLSLKNVETETLPARVRCTPYHHELACQRSARRAETRRSAPPPVLHPLAAL